MTTLTAPRTVADLILVAEETGALDGWSAELPKGHIRFLFRNGWIVSVGYGPTYAADHHGKLLSVQEEIRRAFSPPDADDFGWARSTTAEVMVIKPDGNRMTWPHNDDGILGFEPVESVAALIRMVAAEGTR